MIKKIFLFILLATATFGQNLYVNRTVSSTETVIVEGNYTRSRLELRIYNTAGTAVLITKKNPANGGVDISTLYSTPYTYARTYFASSDFDTLSDNTSYPYNFYKISTDTTLLTSGYLVCGTATIGVFGATNLEDLSDVVYPSEPNVDQLLKYNGTYWYPATVSGGGSVGNADSLGSIPAGSYALLTVTDSLAGDIADLVDGSVHAAYSTYASSIFDSRTGLYHGGSKYLILGEALAQAVSGDVTVDGEVSATYLVGSTLDVSVSAALPDSFTIQGTTLLPSGTELNYVDGVTSSIQTQLNAKLNAADSTGSGYATQADIASFITSSNTAITNKLLKDFEASYTITDDPTGDAVIPISVSNINATASLASLPISDATSTSIATKASIIALRDSMLYVRSEIQRLEQLIYANNPPDVTITPYSITSLTSSNTASATAGTITLTYNDPNGGGTTLYKYVYVSSNGTTFALLDSTTAETYAHVNLAPHDTTYYYYIRTSSGDGTLSNLDTALTFIVSDFVTQNWYVSETGAGAGTGLSWAAMATMTTFSFTNLNAGDTLFFDGGTAGDSLEYLNIMEFIWQDGTADDYIVFARSTDTGHNGVPILGGRMADYFYDGAAFYLGYTGSVSNEAKYIEFNGLYFRGDSGTPTATYGTYNVVIGNSSFITFENCTFDVWTGNGIVSTSYSSPHDITVNNCTFLARQSNDYATDFIHIGSYPLGAGGNEYNLTVTNNLFYSQNREAYSLGHRDFIHLVNFGVARASGDDNSVVFAGNTFIDDTDSSYGAPIYFENIKANVEFYNNVVAYESKALVGGGNAFSAMLSFGSSPTYDNSTTLHNAYQSSYWIYNNTFYSNRDATGHYVTDADTLVYKNNITYTPSNTQHIMSMDLWTETYGYVDIDYNQNYMASGDSTYERFTYLYAQDSISTAAKTWAQWKAFSTLGTNNQAPDAHSFFKAPTFGNLNGNTAIDYMLAAGSNGIDAGTTLTSFTTDNNLETRPIGTSWDIGAFERTTFYDDFRDGNYTSNPVWATATIAVIDTANNPLSTNTYALRFTADDTTYASNTTYGTWEFDFYKEDTDGFHIGFVDGNNLYGDVGAYHFSVTDGEDLRIVETTVATPLQTAAGYIANNTWYRIKITRDGSGLTTLYIKGGAFGSSDWTTVSVAGGSGTNPFTDNTITSTTYLTMFGTNGCQITNIRVY